jgi:hypothetical protein
MASPTFPSSDVGAGGFLVRGSKVVFGPCDFGFAGSESYLQEIETKVDMTSGDTVAVMSVTGP